MKIAALQMQVINGDIDTNIARIATAARKAADGGAGLLIAPELAVNGYGAGEAFSETASPANGAVVERLAAIARENGLAIIAGFAEKDGDVTYNSALFTDGAGTSAVYRKSHLYGDYERRWFRPAAPSSVIVRHGGLNIGMLICYDVEFPENVRRLALDGVDLVVVPTALPASGAFIADKMIQVRAFENQIFVAYINHCGTAGRFSYAGLSRIAAPDGSLLAEAPAEGEALLFAEIAPSDYARSRAENSYLADLARPV